MSDHIEHQCPRCGSLLHTEDRCPRERIVVDKPPSLALGQRWLLPDGEIVEVVAVYANGGRVRTVNRAPEATYTLGSFREWHLLPPVSPADAAALSDARRERDRARSTLALVHHVLDDPCNGFPGHRERTIGELAERLRTLLDATS